MGLWFGTYFQGCSCKSTMRECVKLVEKSPFLYPHLTATAIFTSGKVLVAHFNINLLYFKKYCTFLLVEIFVTAPKSCNFPNYPEMGLTERAGCCLRVT